MKRFIIFIIFIVGCRQMPTPPSWDVTINLPVTSHTFLISDIVDTIIGDTLPIIKVYFTIPTIFIGESLYIDSFYNDTGISISEIKINKTYADSISYSLGQIAPSLPNGDTIYVPELSFNFYDSLKLSEDFTSIGIDSGFFTINSYNGLPLTIDSLYIIFFIPESLGTKFTNILPQQSVESNINLSGKEIYNSILIRTMGWTQAKDSVIIDTSASILTKVSVFINKISSIIGKFPPCSLFIPLDIPTLPFYINFIAIRDGQLYFYINNPIKANFDYRLDGSDCSFLPINYIITHGINDTFINLSNTIITPQVRDTIKLQNYFYTDGGYEVDTLNSQDSLYMKINMSRLKINEFRGTIDSLITINIPDTMEKIDYGIDVGELSNIIQIKDAWLYYDIWNEPNFTPQVDILINGIKNSNSKSLHIIRTLITGENYEEIKGDSVNEFISFLPESISIHGKSSFRGDIYVKYTDKIYGEVGLCVPLILKITDTLRIKSDTIVSIDIPKELREVSIVDTSYLYIKAYNPTPLSGWIYLYLGSKPTDLTSITYFEVKEGNFESKIPLFEEKKFLKYEKIFTTLEALIFPTQEEIKLLPTSRIIIKALLSVKIKTKT